MGTLNDVLYIGIGSHVVAIQTSTGEELWRTRLKRSGYVTIAERPGAIYGGAAGHLFCLDPSTGAIRWQNRLDGLGTGLVTFGGDDSTAAAAASIERAQQAAGASVIAAT